MSELYTLPDGWEWKELISLTDIFSDGDWIESKDQSEDGIRLIQTGNVGIGLFKDREDKSRYISKETFERLNCTEIFENDCLISRLPEPVGRSCLIPKMNSKMITSVDCTIIRFNKNILPKFFVYYSQLNYYFNMIMNNATGATRLRISKKNLSKIPVPIPPLKEQKRIVAKLDNLFAKIDKAIALHQKNIDEANVFMASVLNNVFVELEEKYKYTKLKNAVTKEKTSIKRGPFGSALKKSFFVEKGYLVYEQYHALNNDFSMERYYIDENKFNELKGFEVKAGDIIISCSGAYLGKLAIIPNDFTKGIINQALLKLSLNKNIIINELFVYFWNNLMNNGFFDEVKKGAAIPNMPAVKELKEINIPLPELPIQQKVVSYLDEISQKMEKIKQIQKEKMQSLKALKASILDQAFKGEL